MSYILDALNKSEQERREQDNVPSLQAIHEDNVHGHARNGLKRWLPIAVASLILILLAVILLMWFSRGEAQVSSSGEPISSANAWAGAAQVVAPNYRGVSRQGSEPRAVDTFGSGASASAVLSLYNQPLPGAAPEEAKVPAEDTRLASISVPGSNAGGGDSTLLAAPVQEIHRSLLQAENKRAQITGPESLPESLRSRLPALDYSAHVYSSDESSGFAIINGRSRYKGDLLSNSLFVEAVEEDGVLLNIQGLSFKLKAMKSWPPQ